MSSDEQRLVLQAFRHVARDDALRQTFDDGGLADAGLADQHGVVLGAARKHLHDAADFLVAPDDGIELAGRGRLREVARVALQRFEALLGRRAVGGAALANLVDGRVEALRRDPGLGQDLAGLRALLEGKREQQPLDGDNRSPAFSAIFWEESNTRASSGAT